MCFVITDYIHYFSLLTISYYISYYILFLLADFGLFPPQNLRNLDSTKRQIAEGINIEKIPRERLMSSKNEWNKSDMPACTVTRLKDR